MFDFGTLKHVVQDKPLPGKPLPTTPRGYRYKSEPSLPPTPMMEEAQGYFTSAHYSSDEGSARSRLSLFSLPESIQQRLSVLKPSRSSLLLNEKVPSRPQSRLIPPEHRQPVEYIKEKSALSSSSFRVKSGPTPSDSFSINPGTSETKVEAPVPFERKPSLLQRTLTLGRRPKSTLRSRTRMASEFLERHVEVEEPRSLPGVPGLSFIFTKAESGFDCFRQSTYPTLDGNKSHRTPL